MASQMSAGQWLQLSLTGLSTNLFVNGANNTLGYMDKGCHDPVRKQVRFIGHAHMGDQRFHQYDEVTNTFSNLADPPWDGGGLSYPGYLGHGYQHNAMDPATGDLYYRKYNSPEVYRLVRATGEWIRLANAPNTEITGGLEWLPNIGTQGGLILFLGRSCHRWDKASNTWSTPASGTLTGMTYHTAAVRSVPNNVVLFGGGNGGRAMWKIGATGGAISCPASPIGYGIASSVTTACPVSGDLLVVESSSVVARFSVGSNSWSQFSFSGGPSFGDISAGSHTIAIPMAAYGVIMFIFGNTPSAWLYKHA
jgi:hypothetical protein